MAASSYPIIIEASDKASAVFQKVAREAERTSKAVNQKSSLSNLKDQLGESSGFGLGVKTLIGAGAVSGVTMLGRALADSTAKMIELKEAFKAGEISAGAMVEQMLAAAPIIGQYWQFGRNLRELATGEEAADNAALKAFLAGNDALKQRDLLLEQNKKTYESISETIRDMERDARTASLPEKQREKQEKLDRQEDRKQSLLKGIDSAEQEDRAKRQAVLASLNAAKNDPANESRRAEYEKMIAEEKAAAGTSSKKFAEQRSAASLAFDKLAAAENGRRPELTNRFSAGAESRGTGVGALARSRESGAVDLARDSNKTLKDTKKTHDDGYKELAGLLRNLIRGNEGGYDGARA